MGNHYIRELMARGERARKQIFSPLLSEFGLTPGQGQARILYYLLLKDHVTQKELADNCHFEVTTMSRNLDKLEKLGLLIRQNNPDCRRSFLICLTDKGIAEAKEIKKVFEQFEQIVSDGITKEELEVFLKVMTRMCDNMESYNQKEK
ncbi:MarR family winged helix-turn-helix transcriptional regulator [Lacrimispora aerotolerans]|uniref:MarR family winged helix-turn-helix transcriptional regulator n=1 Tax=Lacrimispora aerotolerans TaxID=36832 RepID=UPI00047C8470|nr:MarR family transcriptional regulator [Lacrimispora aerotolerans]